MQEPSKKQERKSQRNIIFFKGRWFIFILSDFPCPQANDETSMCLVILQSEDLVFVATSLRNKSLPKPHNEAKRKHYCSYSPTFVSFISYRFLSHPSLRLY